MNMILTAVFDEVPPSEGGGFVAYAEELPGAISEGDTLEEARENLRDAVEQLLDYHVSVLEVAGSAATAEDVLAMESCWKKKLKSQEMGLNRN